MKKALGVLLVAMLSAALLGVLVSGERWMLLGAFPALVSGFCR